MTTTLPVYRRSLLEGVKDHCLYRVKSIWIDQVDDSSDLSLLGIALHKVQHLYTLRLVEKQIPQDSEEALAAFTEGIVAAGLPNHLIPEARQLWDWHSEHFELDLASFLSAEERQQTGQVSGALDLIYAHAETNTLETIDFKWGWTPPMTEDELQNLFQARVYAFLASQQFPGFSHYRFTIHAARFNKYVSVVFPFSVLDQIERELQTYVAILEHAEQTNHWPAVAGPSCRFCELACPLVDRLEIAPKRILEAKQAEQIGAMLLAMDVWTRTAKKALKGYVAGHGPVDVRGVVWDNRLTTERKYPLQIVTEKLKQIQAMGGLEPTTDEDGVTISQSGLGKLFKKFPQLAVDLAPYAQEKQTYRFSAKRGGSDEGEDE